MPDLVTMLRARYPAAEYAFFAELRNGTGWSRATRSADAVALSLWHSRGLELLGFECKVSRSDWKRELAEPAKAEAIQRFCDRWWIVVSDPKFVQDGELPPTWGLLAATKGLDEGSKLKVVKDAPKLEAKPLDRLMFASMLRNFADAREADFRARVEPIVQERIEHDRPLLAQQLERAQRDLRELTNQAAAFEAASGFEIQRGWDLPNIGALKTLLFGSEYQHGSLKNLRAAAAEAAKRYTEAAEDAARSEQEIARIFDALEKTEAA